MNGARVGAPTWGRRLVARAMARDLATFVVPDVRLARAAGIDPEAAGLESASTPRHASVLLLVGDLPEGLARAAAVAYAQMPRPRAILSAGGDGLPFLPAPDVSVALDQEALMAGVAHLRTLLAEGAFSRKATALDSETLRTRTEYVCPMHPEIVRPRPGSCPICGMDLVPQDAPEAASAHDHAGMAMDHVAALSPTTEATEYTCPMHSEFVRSEPGRCPICGMDLVPKPAAPDRGMGLSTGHEGHEMAQVGGAASGHGTHAHHHPTAPPMDHAHHGVAPDGVPKDRGDLGERDEASNRLAGGTGHGTATATRRDEHEVSGQEGHGDVDAPGGDDGHARHAGQAAPSGHAPTGAPSKGHGHEAPDPAHGANVPEATPTGSDDPSSNGPGRSPDVDRVHRQAPADAIPTGIRKPDGADHTGRASTVMGHGGRLDDPMPMTDTGATGQRRDFGTTDHTAMGAMDHAAMGIAAMDRGNGGYPTLTVDHGAMTNGADHAAMGHAGMDHGDHTPGGFMSMVAMTKDLPRSRDGLPMEWVEAPFGPLFPGLPAGLALTLTLDGDTVARAALAPGATRRGLEATWSGPAATFSDRFARLDPLAPVAYRTLAYRALEAASGAAIDPASARGRVGVLERERAAGHLGWLAAFGALLGDRALARRAARWQLALTRATDGDEVTRIAADVRGLIRGVERTPLRRRLAGIGCLGKATGAVSGPVARAGGAAVDERTGEAAYRDLGFAPVVAEGGDALARFRVRLGEIGRSLDLIAAAGFVAMPTASSPPDLTGTGAATIETPRGVASLQVEVERGTVTGIWLDDGPWRQAALVPAVAEGAELADALVGVASLDLSPWEMDR